MNVLGTANLDCTDGIKSQLVEISLKDREVNDDNLNIALSVVTNAKPTAHAGGGSSRSRVRGFGS